MLLLKSPGRITLMKQSLFLNLGSFAGSVEWSMRVWEYIAACLCAWLDFSSPCYLMSLFPLLHPKTLVKEAR